MPEPRCLPCRARNDQKRRLYNDAWYKALKPTGDCFWQCGRPATERDHYTPLSEGGKHELGNIVWSCQPCNGTRNGQRGDPRP